MHRRIPPNSTVRRRLFAEEEDFCQQARTDNFLNIQQEIIESDRKRGIMKWNFDIQNEKPLDGVYKWYKRDGPLRWVGINTSIVSDCDDEVSFEEDILKLQVKNECTPRILKECHTPLLRKRRIPEKDDTSVKENGVKRKISFD